MFKTLKLKQFLRSSIIRLAATFLSFGVQFFWLWTVSRWLKSYSVWISLASDFLAAALVIHVYNKQNYSVSLKVPWLILILVLPIVGITLYFLSENNHQSKRVKNNTSKIKAESVRHIKSDSNVLKTLENLDKRVANQFKYLSLVEKFPAFFNTGAKFYGNTVECLDCQLKDLATAQKFIFLEYHAIEEAKAFDRMLPVLKERLAAGAEIRILYDDVGSIGYINKKFIKRMNGIGIACRDFNPLSPLFSLFMNNRDHRKIMVIDGKIGFTGGYNLADEYFNYSHPYGQWKDSGLRIEGKAVNTFTELFLEMWNSQEKGRLEDVSKYFIEETDGPDKNGEFALNNGNGAKNSGNSQLNEKNEKSPAQTEPLPAKTDGFIQPYADMPLDYLYVGENVYLNLIKWAKDFVWITTPYLILGDEMKRELILASFRGVDIRIVTPGVPDKKLVYKITRSFYGELIDSGIKIYEYTPGFIHSKQMIADGKLATVGTVNMDFRSFHHNFENGVLMYNTSAISDIQKDFESLFKISADVTEKYHNKKHHSMSFTDRVLRLFSTLL